MTQLDWLKLATPALNDFCAVALLSSLTALQSLHLECSRVKTAAFVPALAGLTNLTKLYLADDYMFIKDGGNYTYEQHADEATTPPFGWQHHEMMQLRFLTNLKSLEVVPRW